MGRYFGPSRPRRPTGVSPGIPDGQSAPATVVEILAVAEEMEATANSHFLLHHIESFTEIIAMISAPSTLLSTKEVAFYLPLLPLTFPAWLLSYGLVLCPILERLSAPLSYLTIMDLISWSLNAIDTIFSTRSSGSGEPDCPAGTLQLATRWTRGRVGVSCA